jgi:hypothetical protein
MNFTPFWAVEENSDALYDLVIIPSHIGLQLTTLFAQLLEGRRPHDVMPSPSLHVPGDQALVHVPEEAMAGSPSYER